MENLKAFEVIKTEYINNNSVYPKSVGGISAESEKQAKELYQKQMYLNDNQIKDYSFNYIGDLPEIKKIKRL